MTSNYVVEFAEFGTAGGVGNIGENTTSQRPVGYAASFSGTVTDFAGGATQLDLALNNSVTTVGATDITATPTAYTAGEFVVNSGFGTQLAEDEYLILSDLQESNDDITYTYGLSNGGGDTDSARFSFTVTQVPEPSSTALLGLGGLALIARRKRA